MVSYSNDEFQSHVYTCSEGQERRSGFLFKATSSSRKKKKLNMNDKKCSPKSGEDCWVEPRLLIMKMAVQGNERKARKPEGERTRQTA